MITKNYLPISTKKAIIDEVVKNSLITDDNGQLKIDFIGKEVSLNMAILSFYTDLSLEEVDYDTLSENGDLNKIKEDLADEYLFIESMVNNILKQEIEIHNSLAGVINRNLSNLINRIPSEKEMSKLLKNLPKALEKISPETLDILKGFKTGAIK